MNIFKASPEEFQKLEKEFKKTYIGRIMHISRFIFAFIFIMCVIVFIGETAAEFIEGIKFSLTDFATQLMIFLSSIASMFIAFSIYLLGLIHYANSKK